MSVEKAPDEVIEELVERGELSTEELEKAIKEINES